MSKRQSGRRFRKSLVRKHSPNGQQEVYSASGHPKVKTELTTQVRNNVHFLASVQAQMLTNYETDLRRCASLLGAKGCWQYLYQKLPEARRYGVENQLRHLVVTAAERFFAPLPLK